MIARPYKNTQLFVFLFLLFFFLFLQVKQTSAATFYISPSGAGSKNGTSEANAFGSFDSAWNALNRGDTLILLDGTYTQVIHPNIRNGQPGNPITIKAKNDGKAIIDGRGTDIPVRFGENWGPSGPVGNWYNLEGIVAINGTISNIRTERANNINIRRVSAYNASPDLNALVISLVWSDNVLLEDCVAGGTGRYMINVYGDAAAGKNNTVRRCFAKWERWDGKKFCGVSWPNGNNIGLYNVSNSSIENSIAYGRALTGMFTQANDTAASAVGNKILGSMSVLQGRDYNGSVWNYVTYPTRPNPAIDPDTGANCSTNVVPLPNGGADGWISFRMGFEVWGQGNVKGNTFRDLLSVDNAGVGVGMDGGAQGSDTVFDHITAMNNGAVARSDEKSDNGGNTHQITISTFTNSYIGNTNLKGEGARLQNRYVDGNLTSQSLWPWPMEDRIRSEFATFLGTPNFSVNAEICQKYLSSSGSASKGYNMNINCATGPTPTGPTSTPWPTSTNAPSPIPTNVPSAVTLPAKIEAENYSSSTGTFSIVQNSFASNGQRIGNTGTDQPVLIYRVQSPMTSIYSFDFATSTDDTILNKSISLYLDNETSARGTVTITSSGGWDIYKIHTLSNIALSAGAHDIKIRLNSNYFDLDYINVLTGSGITPTPDPGCSLKSAGDADCSGKVELADFEVWRKELTGSLFTKTADFNNDAIVNITDFEIWRKTYMK